jgi:hypothetical protein
MKYDTLQELAQATPEVHGTSLITYLVSPNTDL